MSKPITRRPARRIEDGPGFYMRSRRQAAGKTIAQCGEAIAALGHGPMAAHDIAALEADRPGDYLQLVDALHAHRVFPFDRAHVLALMAGTADPALEELIPGVAA
ncbi:hypothetical protein AAG607_12200 [Citromicrobium bathyomarinum]|uniref:hypothetical protein n=1 Tax=Citromicrobium bathyomarinum TaxID=72174 RepID=UPI00315AD345